MVAAAGGRVFVLKLPSTPADPARAVLLGVEAARRAMESSVSGADPAEVVYGSTVATNALITRDGARVALVVTAGFEDVLRIGRQNRPRLFDLAPSRPAPLVPRARVVGARERVDARGRALVALTRAEARRVARAVGRLRPRAEAVAVSLLHAYANPAHEELLARELAPLGVPVTVASRLLPEHREYERTATCAANAFVAPRVGRALERLRRGLRAGRDAGASLRVLMSTGGAAGAALALEEPVRTALSGPAGGALAAFAAARACGFERAAGLDVGGTSTDASLLDGGVDLVTDVVVGDVPVRVRAVGVRSVGAGGGSVLRVDAGGALRVGPESVGADPGPASYGRGRAAALTDAHLALGRIGARDLADGALRLDVRRARAALARLGRRLGLSAAAAAAGAVRIANAAMARAVGEVTLRRGRDPRELALVAFGGAGGLHACEVARLLGMRAVVLPRDAGVLSAWGALVCDVVRERSATVLCAPRDAAVARAAARLRAMAGSDLDAEGVPAARRRVELSCDLRYRGQSYELNVTWTGASRGLAPAFARAHRAAFGYLLAGRAVEVVAVRVRAVGRVEPPALPDLPRRRGGGAEPLSARPVFFDGHGVRRAPVFDRATLLAGDALRGPCVVREYGATHLVPPDFRARVTRAGHLVLERAG